MPKHARLLETSSVVGCAVGFKTIGRFVDSDSRVVGGSVHESAPVSTREGLYRVDLPFMARVAAAPRGLEYRVSALVSSLLP